MASKWFEGLTEQTQGFMIATLLFKGKESELSFGILNDTDAQIMRTRAASILELERSHRVTLLVAQLKLLLMSSSQPWILAVDPSWIVELIKKEQIGVQRYVLASLPLSLAKSMGRALSLTPEEMESLPIVSPQLALTIRRSIEKQLTPMRAVGFEDGQCASHLLVLTKKELEIVILEAGDRHSESEEGGLKMLARYLGDETRALQNEVAQRLDFHAGQKMIKYIRELEFSRLEDEDTRLEFHALLSELAKNRKIDERFARCSNRNDP